MIQKLLFFITALFIMSCEKNEELSIVISNETQKDFLQDIISAKKYNAKIVSEGNYWVMENTSEDMLLGLLDVAKLKIDMIAYNIANEKTTITAEGEPFARSKFTISPEKGIEIIKDTENPNVNVASERADMAEITHLYDVISECLRVKYKVIVL